MTYPRSQRALIHAFALINSQVNYIPEWDESIVKTNIFLKFFPKLGIAFITPLQGSKDFL